jgi:hypothetical protein
MNVLLRNAIENVGRLLVAHLAARIEQVGGLRYHQEAKRWRRYKEGMGVGGWGRFMILQVAFCMHYESTPVSP